MISAQATVVFTADFTTFDNTSAAAQTIGGATPDLAFGDLFGSDAHVSANGSLNFAGTTNGRSAGVWLDSSLWGAGTATVTFDISGLNATGVASIQIYTADGLSSTVFAGLDMRTGGDPTLSGVATAGAQQVINTDGLAQTFDFTNVADTSIARQDYGKTREIG